MKNIQGKTTSFLIVALKKLISEYRQLNVRSSKKRNWHDRMMHLEDSWAAKRGEIFSCIVSQHRPIDGPCMQCRNKAAVISCADCASWASYLCPTCDYSFHKTEPFHRRSTSAVSGFCEMLPSNVFVNVNSMERVEKSKLILIYEIS